MKKVDFAAAIVASELDRETFNNRYINPRIDQLWTSHGPDITEQIRFEIDYLVREQVRSR